MAKINTTSETITLAGTRTIPPGFREEEFPLALIPIIIAFLVFFLISGILTSKQSSSFIPILILSIILGMGILGYKLFNKNLVRFRIDKNRESITFFNKFGKPETVFYFRDIKNFRITYGIEKITHTDRSHRTEVVREITLYILDAITTVDTAYTIHVDEEPVIRSMAKTIAQFIDRPVHDEGCRRIE